MKLKRCEIEGCTNEVKHQKAKLCTACYSAMYYWNKKTPTQQMIRVGKLELYKNRLLTLTPRNVVRLRRRA
jgi:hypothetical protein